MRPSPKPLLAAASLAFVALIATTAPRAQQAPAGPAARPFNGITTGVGDLSSLSKAGTRSIRPENFTGGEGEGGWRAGERYLPLQDDIASVGCCYQTEPHAPFPALPNCDALEIQ